MCWQGPDLHNLAALHTPRCSEWSSAQRLHTSLAGRAAAAQPDGAHLLRKAKLAALAQEPDSLCPSPSQVTLLQCCAWWGLVDCHTPGTCAVWALIHKLQLPSALRSPVVRSIASPGPCCLHTAGEQDVEALDAQLQLCTVQEQLGLGAAPVMGPQRLGQAALAPDAAPAAALLALDVLGLAGPAFRTSHAYALSRVWPGSTHAFLCVELSWLSSARDQHEPCTSLEHALLCAAGLPLAWLHACSPVCQAAEVGPCSLLTFPASGQALCSAHEHAPSSAAEHQHHKSC